MKTWKLYVVERWKPDLIYLWIIYTLQAFWHWIQLVVFELTLKTTCANAARNNVSSKSMTPIYLFFIFLFLFIHVPAKLSWDTSTKFYRYVQQQVEATRCIQEWRHFCVLFLISSWQCKRYIVEIIHISLREASTRSA